MMDSGVPFCNNCGETVGFAPNGEAFVACLECNYPICHSCVDDEIKEGRKACFRCAAPYAASLENPKLDDVEMDASAKHSTMADHLDTNQDVRVHARSLSNFSVTDSESGNPIWKNRVESWKEKKNKKKKTSNKAKPDAQIPDEQAEVPSEQQMGEKQ